jgi:serine protease inhibitor
MALLYEGARGATEEQMASVFGFSDRFTEGGTFHQELLQLKAAKGSSLALRIANSIWLDQKTALYPEYVEVVRGHYQAKGGAGGFPLRRRGGARGYQRMGG